MKIGILSPEISAGTVAELFRKTKAFGFYGMQFNYVSAGIAEMPDTLPGNLNNEIAAEAAKNGIEIVAVSGTFNMAHPDPAVRQAGIKKFEKIAASCKTFDCRMITLCTGSRNDYMWAPHRDNNTAEAWNDMRAVMEQLLTIASRYDVNLGMEPEASNIVNTPEKAKKIIEELKSNRLKIILDPANLFQPGTAKKENANSVIKNGMELLAPWIGMAHGKDIKEGEGLDFTYPGRGIIDFGFFFDELKKAGYKDGIILHGIKNEKNIPECLEYIKKRCI